MKNAKPVLVAHRGNAGQYLENTLPAFESAARLGVRHVELDVQLTADGIPIVLHDANARRTHGIDIDVRFYDAPALEQKGLFDEQVCGSPVPRLGEFARWMEGNPQMQAFVEIKKESLHTHGRSRVLSAITDALQAVAGRYMLISYDARVLGMAKRRGESVGYVLPTMDGRYRAIARHLSPAVLFADYRQILDAGATWPGSWQWATFEVADRAIARRMTDFDLDYLETMNPALLRTMPDLAGS